MNGEGNGLSSPFKQQLIKEKLFVNIFYEVNHEYWLKRLNLDLALFRNSKSEICCVVDQCTHRGAALSIGKDKGDCIQCPFHGLEFDKNGKILLDENGKMKKHVFL